MREGGGRGEEGWRREEVREGDGEGERKTGSDVGKRGRGGA